MLISEMSTSHLKNTIRVLERIAEEGVTVLSGGGSTGEDMWCDEDVITGKEALRYLKHHWYVEELNERIKNGNS